MDPLDQPSPPQNEEGSEPLPTFEPTYYTSAPVSDDDIEELLPQITPTDPDVDAEGIVDDDFRIDDDDSVDPDAPDIAVADRDVPTAFPTGYPTDEPTDDTKRDTPTFSPTSTDIPTSNPTPRGSTLAPTNTQAPTEGSKTESPTLKPTNKSIPATAAPTSGQSTDAPSMPPVPAVAGTTSKPTSKPTIKRTPKPSMAPIQTPNPEFTIKKDRIPNKFMGFQSDWGSAYPGSMIYDFTRNSVYLTGTTFAENKLPDTKKPEFKRSNCFLGELPIADVADFRIDAEPKKRSSVDDFVIPDDMDVREMMGCNFVYYDGESVTGDVLYVMGVTEPDSTSRRGTITPFLNTYDRTRTRPNWEPNHIAPTWFNYEKEKRGQKTPVKWPIAMATGKMGTNGNGVSPDTQMIAFVTVSSEDELLTEEYIKNGDANNAKNSKYSLQPAGLDPNNPSKYAIPKRGSNFFMSIIQYTYKPREGLKFVHGSDLKTHSKDGELFPTDIVSIYPGHREFVISGYMKGTPPTALLMKPGVDSEGNNRLDDYDGFVAVNNFPQGRPSFEKDKDIRFSSIEMDPPLDDYVHGICLAPVNEETGKVISYYVIGSTWGTMPPGADQTEITTNIVSGASAADTDGDKIRRMSAWISKIDTRFKNRRQVVWTTQLYATNDKRTLEAAMTEAFGCSVVDSEKDKMYVAGTVYGGGVMDSEEKSAGSDDVWVAQLNSDDGSIRWIRQIGSSGDDRLARTNGIEVDVNGHAIVYGETNGELYRNRGGEKIRTDDGTSTDVFITTLDFDSGTSISTVESDRILNRKRNGLIGAGVIVLVALLCVCLGMIAKWRRARRYAAKNTDGVLTEGRRPSVFSDNGTGQNYSDDAESNIAPGERTSKPRPPAEAFQDADKAFEEPDVEEPDVKIV